MSASPRDREGPDGPPDADEAVGAAAPTGTAERRLLRRSRIARRHSGRLPWLLRLAVWSVAIVASFLVTGLPAFALGFVSKNDIVDVFVGSGFNRYFPLVAFAVVWAFVNTVIVEFLLSALRWLRDRRTRVAATEHAPSDPSARDRRPRRSREV